MGYVKIRKVFIYNMYTFQNSVTEKYPQIKKLFGVDSTFKWKVCCLVLVQFAMLYVMKNQPWTVVILAGYLFGGVINHALMLGMLFIQHFFNNFTRKLCILSKLTMRQVIISYLTSYSCPWNSSWCCFWYQVSNCQ